MPQLSSTEAAVGDRTMAELFEAQARRAPEAVALEWHGVGLTYGELEIRANQLAQDLRGHGVAAEVPVGLLVQRSPDLAVGALGILKAGGACVPLDPSYPIDRLAFMVADTAAPVVVTQPELVQRLPAGPARLVLLGANGTDPAGRPSEPTPPVTSADNLAYVFYTSGSTGRPKGVMLPHRGLVHNTLVAAERYRLRPEDRVLQFCSISFGVSVEELFATWAVGATVVFRPDDIPLLGPAWADWLGGRGVSVLNLPTAYWQEWARDLEVTGRTVPESVRLVVVGGDRALASAQHQWERVGGGRARWLNVFGSAEVSHMATIYEPAGSSTHDDDADRDPPIGRPIPGATAHILDEAGEPMNPGEVGELHVGGPGLARGYLNRPGLTAQRFVPDPFGSVPGARLYRTGDLVRRLPDGNISFVGRRDRQVKIRGFRVERDEVERALGRHPQVARALVVAREDRPGERDLVAYVTVAAPVTTAELRRFLAGRLPDYMVPVAFTTLETFPLTANGKVDVEALPPPTASPSLPETSSPRPRTPTEQAVASVWAEVLGTDHVGVDDDFFDLGGHSLLATQAIARLRSALGWAIPLQAIFEAPTVAEFAARLETWDGAVSAVPPPSPRPRQAGAPVPVSLAQEQMLRLEARARVRGLYNLTVHRRFTTSVEREALEAALSYMIDRHESLRTCFSTHSERATQVIVDSVPTALTESDLTVVPHQDREAELHRRIAEQDARPFDVATAPLFRVCLIHLGGSLSELVVTFDHLICDLTSAYVFLDELGAVYQSLASGDTPRLPPLRVQYADVAVWQRRWITDDTLAAQLDYWRQALRDMPLGPCLPFDRIPANPSRRVARVRFGLTSSTTRAVRQLARNLHASSFVICAAAAQALFSRAGGLTDVVLSTTTSGRHHQELDGVIGMFAGIGRIRTSLAGDPTFETIIRRTRDAVLGLFEHQDIPFLRIRDAVLPDFPGPGDPVHLAKALPVELLYFHVATGGAAPGSAVVRGAGRGLDEVYFRGQLHPLSVTFLDEGHRLSGWFSYKPDFYHDRTIAWLCDGLPALFSAVVADPLLRLSELPVGVAVRG